MKTQNPQQAKPFFALLTALLIIMLLSVNAFAYEKEKILKNVDEYVPEIVKIKARADDDFLLTADYYLGGKRSGGVIVLHDCNNDRRSYSKVATSLAQQDLHTLLVDLRGYGGSVSQAYSRETAKLKATDIVTYQGEMTLITTNWPDDLLAMYQFLSKKIDKSKGIAVVASGCTTSYAVALAEKINLNAMVMITPQMTYSDKERYKNLVDIPSYFITSSHHQDSYKTAQELFTWNGAKRSKLQIFKGTAYNYQLISRKTYLVNDIALWVKSNLR